MKRHSAVRMALNIFTWGVFLHPERQRKEAIVETQAEKAVR